SLELSNPGNATLARAQATATVVNDDPHPGMTISDAARVIEPSSGTVGTRFNVRLLAASDRTVTVQYATADGTATSADGDYRSASGTLTFAPGVTSQAVTVQVNGDRDIEPDEAFFLNLSKPVNAILVRSQGMATIGDSGDSLSINDVTLAKGTSGTTDAYFTVTKAAADVTAPVS